MNHSQKPFDVFLSHNSVDKPWVIKLKDVLQEYGLNVWLDRDEIRPGDIFAKALEKGLKESKSVALIVSPESIASGWVEEEYYSALNLHKDKQSPLQLIPVILRTAEIPEFLLNRSWVDFRDESKYDENVKMLVWGITGEKPDKPLLAKKTLPHTQEKNRQKHDVPTTDTSHKQETPQQKESTKEQGGVHVSIGGSVDKSQINVAGHDLTVNAGVEIGKVSNDEAHSLNKSFKTIYQKINTRSHDPKVDREEIMDTTRKIQEEVLKIDLINWDKVARWLGYLEEMAPDIFQLVKITLNSANLNNSGKVNKL